MGGSRSHEIGRSHEGLLVSVQGPGHLHADLEGRSGDRPRPRPEALGTTRVAIDDLGDRLVVRPIPEDPIGAVVGSVDLWGVTTQEMREEFRREEDEAEERKYR